MNDFYLELKAVHIMSIIAWMSCLFYLPRLFIYHVQQYTNIHFKKVVEIQERRLYYYIGYPAMLMSFASGAAIIMSNLEIFKSGGWIHIKLMLVVFMFIFHFLCGFYRKKLLNECYKSEKFFRIFNEIPTLLMIGIVFFAVTKPF